jgi:hypothetical protein
MNEHHGERTSHVRGIKPERSFSFSFWSLACENVGHVVTLCHHMPNFGVQSRSETTAHTIVVAIIKNPEGS